MTWQGVVDIFKNGVEQTCYFYLYWDNLYDLEVI